MYRVTEYFIVDDNFIFVLKSADIQKTEVYCQATCP